MDEFYVVETVEPTVEPTMPEMAEVEVEVPEIEVSEAKEVNVSSKSGIGTAKAIAVGLGGAAAGGIITTYAVRGIDYVIGRVSKAVKTKMADHEQKKLAKKEQKLLEAEEWLDRERTKVEIDKKISKK